MQSIQTMESDIAMNIDAAEATVDVFGEIGAAAEALVYFFCSDAILPLPSNSMLPLSLLAHTTGQLRPLASVTHPGFTNIASVVRAAYRPLARMQRVSRVFYGSPSMPSPGEVLRYVRDVCGVFCPDAFQFFTYETDRFLQTTEDAFALDYAARCLFAGGVARFETTPLLSDIDVGTALVQTGLPPLVDAHAISELVRSRVNDDRTLYPAPRMHVPVVIVDTRGGPGTFRLRFIDEVRMQRGYTSLASVFNGREGLQLATLRARGTTDSVETAFRKMASCYKLTAARWAARVQCYRRNRARLLDRVNHLIKTRPRVHAPPTTSAGYDAMLRRIKTESLHY